MIVVLRLSHRGKRDKRITTHCGLTARAFGADKIILSGEKDLKIMESLRQVTEKWGGPFEVEYSRSWRNTINDFRKRRFKIVHLTMYGQELKKVRERLRKKNLLVVVGSEKVPSDLYDIADYNISIGNQPHSEVAALGVFLYEIRGLKKDFAGAKKRIIPQKKGKKVIEQ